MSENSSLVERISDSYRDGDIPQMRQKLGDGIEDCHGKLTGYISDKAEGLYSTAKNAALVGLVGMAFAFSGSNCEVTPEGKQFAENTAKSAVRSGANTAARESVKESKGHSDYDKGKTKQVSQEKSDRPILKETYTVKWDDKNNDGEIDPDKEFERKTFFNEEDKILFVFRYKSDAKVNMAAIVRDREGEIVYKQESEKSEGFNKAWIGRKISKFSFPNNVSGSREYDIGYFVNGRKKDDSTILINHKNKE